MFEKGVSKIRTSSRKPGNEQMLDTGIQNHMHLSREFKIFMRIYFNEHCESTEIIAQLKEKLNLNLRE